MKSTQEKIAIMQAFVGGEEVESKHQMMSGWNPDKNPRWDWENYDYRTKPKAREIWIIEAHGEAGHQSVLAYRNKRLALKNLEQASSAYPDAILRHYREVTE